MSLRHLSPLGSCFGALALGALAGCGAGRANSGFTQTDAGQDGTLPPSPGPDGGGDVQTFGDGHGPDSPACATHCSSDLHDVLDCNGSVVLTCPLNEGCAAGACVLACDAAKANKSTIGCDYFSVDPDVILGDDSRCFAAYIANTWGSPVSITVDRAGQTFDLSTCARIPSGSGQSIVYSPLPGGQVPPGQVAVIFLAKGATGSIACPPGITPAYTVADAALHGTGLGESFHIATTAPVVAYDIYPYGGGPSAITSATLLLPTTAWDTNYIAVNAFRPSQLAGQPSLDIVALADGTTVTIRPTADIVAGGGVSGASKGVPQTYSLNRGQTLQFTQSAELTGSPIQSNNPVGVWGAASCINIDVGDYACDSAHQQLPPVQALGHEYVGVRYRNRIDGQEETVPWRLVGAVDGTTLSYEPAAPTGAPPSLAEGQLAEFDSSGPFVVRSQDDKHPFYVSAHMTSGSHAAGAGDPEFVNVTPAQEYLASYTFFTDPTYPETNLVMVRTKGSTGFADVKLDCAGTLTGWQPVGTSGNYEYARIDLVRHDFQGQNGCDNGRHVMTSTLPFGLTVWGWGTSETSSFTQYVSYAYPAGASVQPINTVVVPPSPK